MNEPEPGDRSEQGSADHPGAVPRAGADTPADGAAAASQPVAARPANTAADGAAGARPPAAADGAAGDRQPVAARPANTAADGAAAARPPAGARPPAAASASPGHPPGDPRAARPSKPAGDQATPLLGPTVVVLGGGHGLASTIRAVRRYAGRVTAVVSVADDGGSSGRLRQIAGIPAPGDLRRCLVAMASETSLWAPAFEYRFPSGDLEGHALGNLIIAGLANVTGDFTSALEIAGGMVEAVGRVLPATAIPVVLKADVSGTEVVGQVNVSQAWGAISAVSVVPPDASVPDDVVSAILDADQVVIGPGSLFTSVLAVCVVPGILAALNARTGGRVYVCNLRPQLPETAGFDDADHLQTVLAHGIPIDVMVAADRGAGPAMGGEDAGASSGVAGEGGGGTSSSRPGTQPQSRRPEPQSRRPRHQPESRRP